jgi:nicotinamide-nucleotide amidase
METVVGRLLTERRATLATAESCTGGLIGHRVTAVAGSSAYFLGGVVAYSNACKVRDLGVSEETLREHGAVSRRVAGEMAAGVRRRFAADYGLAVTGIAGPSGGTPEKPVGLVCLAVAGAGGETTREIRLAGDRSVIKEWSSQMALDFLRRRLLGVKDA